MVASRVGGAVVALVSPDFTIATSSPQTIEMIAPYVSQQGRQLEQFKRYLREGNLDKDFQHRGDFGNQNLAAIAPPCRVTIVGLGEHSLLSLVTIITVASWLSECFPFSMAAFIYHITPGW